MPIDPNLLGAFAGINLPQLDAQRRQNALGNLDLQATQQKVQGMMNPNATPEQLARSGNVEVANSVAQQQQVRQQNAMRYAGTRLLAVSQSNDPGTLMKQLASDPNFGSAAEAVGLPHPSQIDSFEGVDPNQLRQQAANLARILGATPPDYTLSKDQSRRSGMSNAEIAAGPPDAEAAQRIALSQQTAAETARHNRVMEGFGRPSGTPNGYEADPQNPGGLRPIVGGPADPSGGAGQGSRAELMFNRVVSAANEATAAIKNISELPITASTGFFGTASPGTGLLSSTKSVLAQKVSSQDAQDTKVMFAGLARALGAIETSGLQVNGSLIHSMESITLNEGDTQMTKLRKMAEVRQIVEKGLEPNLSNPKIPPQQKQLVQQIIADIQDAVPYTHHDITQLQYSKNPAATISDFAKSSGVQKGGLPQGVTEDDITETMRANRMTRDQVLQRLNAR